MLAEPRADEGSGACSLQQQQRRLHHSFDQLLASLCSGCAGQWHMTEHQCCGKDYPAPCVDSTDVSNHLADKRDLCIGTDMKKVLPSAHDARALAVLDMDVPCPITHGPI